MISTMRRMPRGSTTPQLRTHVSEPPPPPPVLGERPPLLLNEQGASPSEDEDEAPTRSLGRSRATRRGRGSHRPSSRRGAWCEEVADRCAMPGCYISRSPMSVRAEKWTFAHAADPCPSAEDKAALAQGGPAAGHRPPLVLEHAHAQVPQAPRLKPRAARRVRGAALRIHALVQATDADEKDPARALASDPAAFCTLSTRAPRRTPRPRSRRRRRPRSPPVPFPRQPRLRARQAPPRAGLSSPIIGRRGRAGRVVKSLEALLTAETSTLPPPTHRSIRSCSGTVGWRKYPSRSPALPT